MAEGTWDSVRGRPLLTVRKKIGLFQGLFDQRSLNKFQNFAMKVGLDGIHYHVLDTGQSSYKFSCM